MASVLVRNIDDETLSRLKERAQRHGRSLQAELRLILDAAGQEQPARAHDLAALMRQRLSGRQHGDSGQLQAEDRRR